MSSNVFEVNNRAFDFIPGKILEAAEKTSTLLSLISFL
jgi:hypothetical protein